MIASVILAAGPGTRLGPLGERMPKAMIPVAGRPYLERLIVKHMDAGLSPVVVAVHHLAKMIRDHFGREPVRWGDLKFVFTGQRGTGADLLDCLSEVTADAFMVWNGDTIVDLDIPALLALAVENPTCGIVVLTQRAGVPNEGAFYVADDGMLLSSLEARPPQAVPNAFAWRGSSTGVMLLRKSLLVSFASASSLSLEATVLPALVARRQLRAFDNGTRYFLDFGTPAGLEQVGQFTDEVDGLRNLRRDRTGPLHRPGSAEI